MQELLKEVRKAYRLLFDYQSRILDLMDFIGKTYEIPFGGGYSQFTRAVRRKGQLNNWAWDWLPMYYYEFFFEKNSIELGHLRFSAFLLNDSGFYDSKKEEKTAEKLNLGTFKDINQSESKLILVAGKDFWWDEWDKKVEDLPRLLNQGKAENGDIVYKTYNLKNFGDEENAMAQLKDFSEYCLKNGIPLTISERKLNSKL